MKESGQLAIQSSNSEADQKKAMETPLPNGFIWSDFTAVNSEDENEQIKMLNEISEFVQKYYKGFGDNFLNIKNYLKWMMF